MKRRRKQIYSVLTTETTVVTVINMKFGSELPGNQDKKENVTDHIILI